MERRKYVLGLDIGITSVGWGIIDTERNKIIAAGVRLFEEANPKQNADRRAMRSARRVLRRRRHRVERMKRLLRRHGIISHDTDLHTDGITTPYHIRVKGIREPLSNCELAIALIHLAKKRGTDNIDIVANDENEQKELGATKDAIARNSQLLRQGKYICEIQLERLESGDHTVRGTDNRFRTDDYINELHAILSQRTDLSQDFKDAAENIIKNRRAYYDGPGSPDSPTPYGQFYCDNGVIKPIGMIEKMRGKCSLYPEEFRAPRMSYTASLFNLLNQLNNITYDGDKKITPEQKKEVVEKFINTKSGITPKQLAKLLGVDNEELLAGIPVDGKGRAYLVGTSPRDKFPGLHKLRKVLDEKNMESDHLVQDTKLTDEIITILTDEKDIRRRVEKIGKCATTPERQAFLTQRTITVLSEIGGFTGYHSFSLRAMREMMDDLFATSQNQMQIITNSGIGAHSTADLRGRKNIPFRDEEIYSPVARRAQCEAIKVINAVRKKYGEMDSIVIEMARDRNSKEQQDAVKERNKKNLLEKEMAENLLREHGVSFPENIDGLERAKLRDKIRFYIQQEGKCIYSGDPIDLRRLITDPHYCEIDHILPISVSFDDSLANKVLSISDYNRAKGNLSPYLWLKSGAGPRSYEKFKEHVLSLKGINRKKRNYLLFEGDINKYDTQRDFLNRNLVDTRYATRALLNMVQDYMRANNIPTKVHTVRAAVTAAFRRKAGIKKSREENYAHHAIDALIVAGIKKSRFMQNVLDASVIVARDGTRYDSDTGEIITPENEDAYYGRDFANLMQSLRNGAYDFTISYSHKVDRKPNRTLFDQTIYGTRIFDGERYIIDKIKDIYSVNDKKVEKLAKAFRDAAIDDANDTTKKKKQKAQKDLEKYLMAQHDPVTFDLLRRIATDDAYADAKNPFAAYKEEHGPIRKHGKENGPIIKSLRYKSKRLGSHKDISTKYRTREAHKVVALQTNWYRIDVYREPDGRYKFLRILYTDLRKKTLPPTQCAAWGREQYFIDRAQYAAEKRVRGISDEAKFCFSLHKREVFGFVKQEQNEQIVLFNEINYNKNIIGYEYIDRKAVDKNGKKQRNTIAISEKITALRKYSTDVLGKRYRIERESCTFTLPVL